MTKLRHEEKTGNPVLDRKLQAVLDHKSKFPDRFPSIKKQNFLVRVAEKGYIDKTAMRSLSEQEKFDLANLMVRSRIKRIQRDPSFFLFNYVWTLDPHDKAEPIKKMPYKKYIWYISEVWKKCRLLVIPKSRQMTVSWTMVALHYWLAAFHPGQYVFFQSKKEEDADILLERAKFIHDHLPDWLRPPGKKSYCWFTFDEINSKIQAVSQESDAIRMQTASAIFSDEMAFQPYAAAGFAASQPTIVGGGRFVGVSTANGKEFFHDLVHDISK